MWPTCSPPKKLDADLGAQVADLLLDLPGREEAREHVLALRLPAQPQSGKSAEPGSLGGVLSVPTAELVRVCSAPHLPAHLQSGKPAEPGSRSGLLSVDTAELLRVCSAPRLPAHLQSGKPAHACFDSLEIGFRSLPKALHAA